MDVPLRCACGVFRGVLRSVTPRSGNRCVCYCDDCQSFAYFLGRADSILDAHGGTDIFQTSPARLEISAGEARLASLRLRPGSNTVRWYASCCRTPLGNTPAEHRVPFVGVIHSCLDTGSLGSPADAVLGPIRGRFFRRFARGDRAGVPKGRTVLPILRLVRMILGARLRRDQLHSPFFSPEGEPKVAPHVLSGDELRAVEGARDAARGRAVSGRN
jgi:hypothetical protein